MKQFETNNEMEALHKLRNEQPEVFAKFSPTTKMQFGLYLNNKAAAAGTAKPTQADIARIGELKQRLTAADITPGERISAAFELEHLEGK